MSVAACGKRDRPRKAAVLWRVVPLLFSLLFGDESLCCSSLKGGGKFPSTPSLACHFHSLTPSTLCSGVGGGGLLGTRREEERTFRSTMKPSRSPPSPTHLSLSPPRPIGWERKHSASVSKSLSRFPILPSKFDQNGSSYREVLF